MLTAGQYPASWRRRSAVMRLRNASAPAHARLQPTLKRVLSSRQDARVCCGQRAHASWLRTWSRIRREQRMETCGRCSAKCCFFSHRRRTGAHRSRVRMRAKECTHPMVNNVFNAQLLSCAPETQAPRWAEQQRGPLRRSGGYVCFAPEDVPAADAARARKRRMGSRAQRALAAQRVSGSTRTHVSSGSCCVSLCDHALTWCPRHPCRGRRRRRCPGRRRRRC